MGDHHYVLEVVRFITNKNESQNKGGKLEHIGYMKAIFKTKNNACSYYDRCNPHMRSLNAYGTYCSDWDPYTELKYIVREGHCLIDTVPTFSTEDMPVNNKYKFLK